MDLSINVKTRIDIGTRLREARLAAGLTQSGLAEISGTTQAAVQKIENGKSLRPRIDEDLARALNLPIEWLRSGVVGVEADLEQARQAGYTER
jgi:transcriptional regulator with XRE-family HTH domain